MSRQGQQHAERERQEFEAGSPTGVLIVDKPVGPSSTDIVRAVKRAYGFKKGVGHTGTLDPFASGVMVVCLGRSATRLVPYLQLEGDKEYEAEILLGEETDTLDSTGAVTATADVPAGITPEIIAAVLDPMVGAVWMQVPPIYSALKIKGESAYEYARRGEHVEMAARPVEMRAYELMSLGECGKRVKLRIRTGSGFYVRSLAYVHPSTFAFHSACSRQ